MYFVQNYERVLLLRMFTSNLYFTMLSFYKSQVPFFVVVNSTNIPTLYFIFLSTLLQSINIKYFCEFSLVLILTIFMLAAYKFTLNVSHTLSFACPIPFSVSSVWSFLPLGLSYPNNFTFII